MEISNWNTYSLVWHMFGTFYRTYCTVLNRIRTNRIVLYWHKSYFDRHMQLQTVLYCHILQFDRPPPPWPSLLADPAQQWDTLQWAGKLAEAQFFFVFLSLILGYPPTSIGMPSKKRNNTISQRLPLSSIFQRPSRSN